MLPVRFRAVARAVQGSVNARCHLSTLSHIDEYGEMRMVDVGDKEKSARTAVAESFVVLGPEAFSAVEENRVKKGDVLAVAKLAGVMAAKDTSRLIPLCHNIVMDHISVQCILDSARYGVKITASARCAGKTGVEMEALTAASVAALTVYDMCKAITHDITITDVRLVSKTGGMRGDFARTA